MSKRGFTVVEIIVVITVLAIIATMSVVSYSLFLDRGEESNRRTIAANVLTATERSYTKNNEYPSAASLIDGTTTTIPNGNRPANYQFASTKLDMPIPSFTATQAEFVPCAPGVAACVPSSSSDAGKRKVYYFMKNSNAAQSIAIGSCTYTFPAFVANDPLLADTAAIVAYWSNEANTWYVSKTAKGTVQTSNATSCPFRAL